MFLLPIIKDMYCQLVDEIISFNFFSVHSAIFSVYLKLGTCSFLNFGEACLLYKRNMCHTDSSEIPCMDLEGWLGGSNMPQTPLDYSNNCRTPHPPKKFSGSAHEHSLQCVNAFESEYRFYNPLIRKRTLH